MSINEILLLWFLFISASAFVGALLGTLSAFGVRSLYRKVKKWMDE